MNGTYTAHGKPNTQRFAELLLTLLAEQEGLCVTHFEYEKKAPVHGGNRERAKVS